MSKLLILIEKTLGNVSFGEFGAIVGAGGCFFRRERIFMMKWGRENGMSEARWWRKLLEGR